MTCDVLSVSPWAADEGLMESHIQPRPDQRLLLVCPATPAAADHLALSDWVALPALVLGHAYLCNGRLCSCQQRRVFSKTIGSGAARPLALAAVAQLHDLLDVAFFEQILRLAFAAMEYGSLPCCEDS